MRLFDSHAHVSRLGAALAGHREPIGPVLARAAAVGVRAIVSPAVGPADWSSPWCAVSAPGSMGASIAIVRALGLHPVGLGELGRAAAERALAALPGAVRRADGAVVAIGECGLDGRTAVVERAPLAWQIEVFAAQLRIARELDLPVVVHGVAAHRALVDTLDAAPLPPVILHGFSGSAELARHHVTRGRYLGFNGAITQPRARRIHEVLRAVPFDRVLLETDAPDQTPATRRPAVNEPAFVADVAAAVAASLAAPLDEVAEQTWTTAMTAFRLDAGVLARARGEAAQA
jgi:TatD DNase family protein